MAKTVSQERISRPFKPETNRPFLRRMDEVGVQPQPVPSTKSINPIRGKKARYALVRPFSPNDAIKLSLTFDAWDTFFPCNEATAQRTNGELNSDLPYTIDLYLVFSRKFSDFPTAESAVDGIGDRFSRHDGWGRCFGAIFPIENNMSEEEDKYEPKAVQDNPMWVNGPNRQFERSYRYIQSRGYDAMFLMEADTYPRGTEWMDQLLTEVQQKAPFAILGSKYDGHSWDLFFDQIPLSLLHHINGNAVYNTSHPLLNSIVTELESEAFESFFNTVPYDYRISQMMMEGALGIHPEFPHKYMHDENGKVVHLPSKIGKFKQWWDLYGDSQPIKESSVIQNFAATNYLREYLNKGSIVHGREMYNSWNPKMHKISLLISDWDKDYSKNLLRDLDMTVHPFSEVVVFRPEDSPDESFFSRVLKRLPVRNKKRQKSLGVNVKVQYRTHHDFMDLCDAHIRTEWFMMTNSYHKVDTTINLMFEHATHKPLVPFTPAFSPYCDEHNYCRITLKQAQAFHLPIDKIVSDFEILYKTSSRDAFCNRWKTLNGKGGEKVLNPSIHGPRGPTATSYIAYLYQHGLAEEIYHFSDATFHGRKPQFVKILEREENIEHDLSMKSYEESISTSRAGANGYSGLSKKGLNEMCSENDDCFGGFCSANEHAENSKYKTCSLNLATEQEHSDTQGENHQGEGSIPQGEVGHQSTQQAVQVNQPTHQAAPEQAAPALAAPEQTAPEQAKETLDQDDHTQHSEPQIPIESEQIALNDGSEAEYEYVESDDDAVVEEYIDVEDTAIEVENALFVSPPNDISPTSENNGVDVAHNEGAVIQEEPKPNSESLQNKIPLVEAPKEIVNVDEEVEIIEEEIGDEEVQILEEEIGDEEVQILEEEIVDEEVDILEEIIVDE
eukprot:CAMPEP_0194392952 /NCGR_PEP_ID=MMETSP0174-20130528/123023_1 /TAXON_ID=216777 /ORGANISM="Proboscia alata, Strain PI-D3" /LENGTH=896 /DNA_ID=CAMNT_0039188573 /DNA_START=356 /DNA_END=3047 /DNA_ORIENTATION=+